MRRPIGAFLLCCTIASCTRAGTGSATMTDAEKKAIADTIRREVVAAYDVGKGGDVVGRLMSLYPSSGAVLSTAGGKVVTNRDTLEGAIRYFWRTAGQNMRDPHWEWTAMYIDVLAPDVAAMTATYRVPHTQPNGMPHVIGGAWTAIFARREGRWVIVQEHLSDNPNP